MKYTKRMLAFLLAVCMVFTSVQMPINAEEDSAIETVADDLNVEESSDEESEAADENVEEGDSAADENVEEGDSAADENVEEDSAADEDDEEDASVEETTDEDAAEEKEATETEESSEDGEVSEEIVEENISYAIKREKEVVDAAIIFTDLHTNKSNYKDGTIQEIFGALKGTGLPFSSVTSGGDAFSVNEDNSYSNGPYNGYTETINTSIRSALGDSDIPVNYVWSDHDRYVYQENDTDTTDDDTTLLDKTSRIVYGLGADGEPGTEDDGNYYVYALSMGDLSSNDRYSAGFVSKRVEKGFTATVEQAIDNFETEVGQLKTDRPLFIVAHQPLLARRGDNGYAADWCEAINKVAATRDVAYFFGHNHKYDVAADYYYEKGSEMPVAQNNGDKVGTNTKINFTHICAGYMEPSSTGSTSNTTRQGTVMAITIYEDGINYATYNKNGKFTGTYSVDETIVRDWTDDDETTDPDQPVDPDQPIDPDQPTNPDDSEEQNSGTAVDTETKTTVSAPGVTAVTVTKNSTNPYPQIYRAYAKYDITPEGYSDGTEATVSIELDNSFSKNGQVIVFDVKNQTSSVQKVMNRVVTFTTNHFSEYDVAEVAETAVLEATGTIFSGISSVTSIDDEGGYYLIGNNRKSRLLTGTKTNNNRLELRGSTSNLTVSSINNNNLWYISPVNEGYYIQLNGPNGDYLSFEDQTATLISTSNVVSVQRSNDNWKIFKNRVYLNDYNRDGNAAGWYTYDANDEGNRWSLYKVTVTPVTLSVTPSPIRLNGTGATYQIVPNVTVGESLADVTHIRYSSNNENIVTVSATGGKVTAVGEGTTTIQVTLSSANGDNLQTPIYVDVPVTVDVISKVTLDSTEGTVSRHSSLDTVTGSKLIVTYANGTTEKIDVTLDMLSDPSGTLDLNSAGVYAGLNVNYAGYTITDYTLNVVDEYDIEITHGTTNEVVEHTLVVKNVEENSTYDLNYKGILNGQEVTFTPDKITWTSSDSTVANIDENGNIVFPGGEGLVRITVVYEYAEGKSVTDSILISVSKGSYIIPEDGTNDFPEYPNEGSIRFDKTATAVGNFSETGITQIELSMTGVPFTSKNKLDVVVMLDRSSSMPKAEGANRINNTIAATEAFIRTIVINEDGSFNGNRIMIYDFLGGNPAWNKDQHKFQANRFNVNEDDGYQIINNEAELQKLLDDIENGFVGQQNVYGTDYANGLKTCYEALLASQEDGNQQFCVFMSDGIPNVYQGETNYFDGTTTDRSNGYTPKKGVVSMFTGTNSNTRDTDYEYEKYSTLMKNNGVTVYTVGLGLQATNSSWSGASATACLNVASILLNDIAGPAKEKVEERDTGSALTKLDSYFYNVEDSKSAENMAAAFENIANKIRDAATNVKVTDKISDKYTMIFDIPGDFVKNDIPEGQEFYIEVVDYALKAVENNGVVVDYERSTETSLMKLYLAKDSDGNFYAASDAKGGSYPTPVYTAKKENQMGYYNLVEGKYVFVADGSGMYNMTSGALVTGDDNQNVVISTPYMHYEASTRLLVWTTDKLSSSELALRYFLYLNDSAAEENASVQVPAGTYATNDYATLDYTNFNGNLCQQIFPVPQMTWSGAQVSYVFYLVNEAGQPVNRAGRLVPFSEAVYVTDTYTEAVIWHNLQGAGKLEASYLASAVVPEVYELYDSDAKYVINVYENEFQQNKNSHFQIFAGNRTVNTTYVFNTKGDKVKYKVPDTYYKDDVHAGFDFSNTTVAFAVVWKPELAEDVVVIDYGLPVDIDVAKNDAVAGAVTGVFGSNNAGILEDYEINKGQLVNHLRIPEEIMPDGNTGMKYGKAERINSTTVRYTPMTMNMSEEELFYYVTTLNYYEGDTLYESRMYSSVTVIPAANIYYEDTEVFVTYTDSTVGKDDETYLFGKWTVDGTENKNAIQAQDRPGADKISSAFDADNIYGYDGTYLDCDTYSLGSAHKVTVSSAEMALSNSPTATFTFTGTAFDIISMTNAKTGTILVKVQDSDGVVIANWIVDTYYNYKCVKDDAFPYLKHIWTYGTEGKWHAVIEKVTSNELAEGEVGEKPIEPKEGDKFVTFEANYTWEVVENSTDSLYQIPVIKSPELGYGTYTVTITPRYAKMFDHTDTGSYEFYLDAIRIYNPAEGDLDVEAVYDKDGENYAEYVEIRKKLISQSDLDTVTDTIEGAVFIDGFGTTGDIGQYTAYGPNNEVYLNAGQAVAFALSSESDSGQKILKAAHIGVKAPRGGDVSVEVAAIDGMSKSVETSGATELYYDISECVEWTDQSTSKVIVITNKGSNMVSLTNLKLTHEMQAVGKLSFRMMYSSVAEVLDYVTASYLATVPTEEPTKNPTEDSEGDKENGLPGDSKEDTDKEPESLEDSKNDADTNQEVNTGTSGGAESGSVNDVMKNPELDKVTEKTSTEDKYESNDEIILDEVADNKEDYKMDQEVPKHENEADEEETVKNDDNSLHGLSVGVLAIITVAVAATVSAMILFVRRKGFGGKR